MNSACSSHGEEGDAKLGGGGCLALVSIVMRWFGRWLRGRRLRWWWAESAVGGRRRRCRWERNAGRRRERRSRWHLCHWWGAALMEIMVVTPVVEVEVGADVAAAGAGDGRKRKWWAATAVEKKGEIPLGREKCGGDDGFPTGGDNGGGGWRHGWEGEREEGETVEKEEKQGRWLVFLRVWTRFSPPSGHQIRLYL